MELLAKYLKSSARKPIKLLLARLRFKIKLRRVRDWGIVLRGRRNKREKDEEGEVSF